MKNKTLSFVIASVLTLIFLVSFASAATTFSVDKTELVFSPSSNSQAFTITNKTNLLNISLIPSLEVNGVSFNAAGNNLSNLGNISESRTITITPTNPIDFSTFDFLESFSDTFVLVDTDNPGENETMTITIENSQFCTVENPGELRVRIEDIKVLKGDFGEGFGDDEEWAIFDKIEVELEIENRGDDDIDNIKIEWGLYNTEAEEWTIEIDDVKDFNIKDGDDEIVILSFQIDEDMDQDLDQLDDGIYKLYVRATGDVDNSSNLETCDDVFESVDIVIEDNFVILDKLELPETSQCGADVHFSADVWNIGDRNQDDVYVRIESTPLKIFEEIIVGDIDSFEDDKIVFDFTLPKDLEEGKNYYLVLSVFDEDDDVYENNNDDNSAYDISFQVENCVVAEASVSANLVSGGKAGRPLVVNSIIANTGDEETTYTLNLESYSDWASQASLEKSTVTIAPGESEEVSITLEVNKGVEGVKFFNLEVFAEDELIADQPVQVTIKKSGFNIPSLSDNWHLWAIGALNLILVIFIIIIAVRIARK